MTSCRLQCSLIIAPRQHCTAGQYGYIPLGRHHKDEQTEISATVVDVCLVALVLLYNTGVIFQGNFPIFHGSHHVGTRDILFPPSYGPYKACVPARRACTQCRAVSLSASDILRRSTTATWSHTRSSAGPGCTPGNITSTHWSTASEAAPQSSLTASSRQNYNVWSCDLWRDGSHIVIILF